MRKISIKEDTTPNERAQIKEIMEEANKKNNSSEHSLFHKVVGSLRRGNLRIVKVTRKS